MSYNEQKPSDYHRSLRSLDLLKYWKGLEFRTMLLYVGIVVLKETLDEEEYIHFMILSLAATICSCSFYKKFQPLASKMFEEYVHQYIRIYGEDSIGSNVHNLIHIVEDMTSLNVSNLSEISTYRYENCLGSLGDLVVNYKTPLEQVARRLIEASKIEEPITFNPKQFKPFVEMKSTFENNVVFRKITIAPHVMLSQKFFGDNWFLSRSNDIVKISHIIQEDGGFEIYGFKVLHKEPFFDAPINSTKFHIFSSDGELDKDLSRFDLKNIFAKLWCLSSKNRFVYMPILHSIDELNKN